MFSWRRNDSERYSLQSCKACYHSFGYWATDEKKLTDKCNYYEVPYRIADDRETLSNAIGKSHRVAIAILDTGFAAKIKSLLG